MANHRPTISIPELSVRQLVIATLVVGLVFFAFWLVFSFNQAFLILLAGIIISVALKPVVTRLNRRGVPVWAAVLLFYLLLGVLFALFLLYGLPLITQQVATIAAEIGRGYDAFRESLLTSSNLIIKRLAETLPAEPGMLADAASQPSTQAQPPAEPGNALQQGLRVVGVASNVIFQVAAIFVIAFFWTLEAERIKRAGILLLPRQRRDGAREMIQAMEERVSAYVSGQLLLAIIIGGLALIAYFIIGLPNALVLGLFVMVMEVIPVVGPLIAAVPAVILAFSISPAMALWVVLALIIIHQLESNVIGPRVMKRAMDMRPIVTLLALAAFGSLFGVLGALVALPLASILQLFLDRYVLDISAREATLPDRSRVGVIRYEIQNLIEDTRKLIRQQDTEALDSGEQIEDIIEAIAVDLDSILAQAGEEPESE